MEALKPLGTMTQKLYWGILHCHVQGRLCHNPQPFEAEELAELERQVDSLYAFARDDRKFDFLAYADHCNMGGMVRMGNTDGSPWRVVRNKAADEFKVDSTPTFFINGKKYAGAMPFAEMAAIIDSME